MEPDARKTASLLLIEDDPGDQELTRRALTEGVLKTDLHVVSDGEEALDYLFRRGPFSNAVMPDLILLDLNMPNLDGREVLRTIRADQRLGHIPVVVLTTSKYEADILRSYELGCNSFITKPVRVDEFVETIQKLGRYWLELVTLPTVS